jgi:hypothetical protein
MNTTKVRSHGTNSKTTHEDMKSKLSTLWIFLLLNMLFADIFSFMYPGGLQKIMTGVVDGTQITPEFLLIAAIITEISVAMVFLSRLLKYRVNRWANIIGGVITIIWVVAGGSWSVPTYIFLTTIEVVCALVIIWMAWNWKPAVEPAAGN